MLKLAIQTGRNFGPHGNRIAAVVEASAEGMQISFFDYDRGFGGVMVSHDLVLLEDLFLLSREVVRRIDVGRYDYALRHPAQETILYLRRMPWAVWRSHKATFIDVSMNRSSESLATAEAV